LPWCVETPAFGREFSLIFEQEIEMIYIAAPFFNEQQSELVSSIEDCLHEQGIPYYSPRQEGVLTPNANNEEKQRIFDSNVDTILDGCSMMLVVTDYLLPEGITLQVCDDGKPFRQLLLPDTGTTFEVGAGFALEIPMVAIHTGRRDLLNVMLANAFDGFVYSLEQLDALIERFSYWVSDNPQWRLGREGPYLEIRYATRQTFIERALAEDTLKSWEGKIQ
jgi:nucleoside 2-deoxyribosyltransferase